MIEFNIFGHGHTIARYAGTSFSPESDAVVAHTLGGKLLGGVVYKDYTGASVTMHVAGFSPRWIDKDMLWVAFHYPFVQLGCERVFGQVNENNTHALEFDRRLGFKEIVRIPGVYPDGAMVLMGMERPHCRWLDIKPFGLKSLDRQLEKVA